MFTYIKDKRSVTGICLIALYNFVFLGTEYFFDNVCAHFVGEHQVVTAQNTVLGISAIGFLVYGLLYRYLGNTVMRVLESVLCAGVIVLLGMLNTLQGYSNVLICGCVMFLFLGIFGAKICYCASTRLPNLRYMSRTMGFGYALGILLQFLNNNLVQGDMIQSIVLASGMMILFALSLFSEKLPEVAYTNEHREMKSVKMAILMLVVVTALMTLIFSTLDNAVTLVHASGDFDIGQWPRLLLALSGIVAGILYDIKERKYMPYIMYAVTITSVGSMVILQLGGSFLYGLLIFYISAGFFVVFFMTAFMQISYYTTMPRLWAGLGRGVNNACACLTAVVSLALLGRESPILVLMVALVLFVFISLCMIGYHIWGAIYELGEATSAKELVNSDAEKEKKAIIFGRRYHLTEREMECLDAIVYMDCSVSEIAAQLSISRAALYRHIANMNQKTGTKDRKELIRLYYEMNQK